MQTGQLHLPAKYGRSPARPRLNLDKYSIAGILSFAALGFLVLGGLYPVVLRFPQYGVLAAAVIVVAIPLGLLAGVLAVPQLHSRLGVLWSKLRWWHALWVLLYISTLVFRVRNQEATQAEPVDAWTLIRIGPEMIVTAWLMVRLYHRRNALEWIRYMFHGLTGVLAIFALVCVASTVWSVYPAWTLYKSLEYLLDISVLAAALANIRTLTDYED